MPKILHTYRYAGRPWEILQSVVPNEFVVETLVEPTREQLIRQAADADYFLVSGRLVIDEEVLAAAPHLKMIQRTGVGTEMLDLEAIKHRNIPVYVNAGVNARSVAEHTITLMLASLKRLTIVNRQVRAGVWKKQETGISCHELYGKTVGLVGIGAIGRLVAKYLNAFGAKVIYTDIYRLPKEQEEELGLTFYPSDQPSTINPQLLSQSDILSLHCPLTMENERIICDSTLSLMKDGAILVNTARGKLIDEAALYEALRTGRLAFAGLDVHYEEPMKPDDSLKQLDNVILTPHVAGLSYEAFYDMMKKAIDNIIAYHNTNVKNSKNNNLP